MNHLSAEMKTKIVERLKPLDADRIILFGSHAYGSPTEHSDLDLCIIDGTAQNRWKRKALIRTLLDDLRMPLDILTPTPDEFDFYKDEINSVYHEAHTKGIVLWRRS